MDHGFWERKQNGVRVVRHVGVKTSNVERFRPRPPSEQSRHTGIIFNRPLSHARLPSWAVAPRNLAGTTGQFDQVSLRIRVVNTGPVDADRVGVTFNRVA